MPGLLRGMARVAVVSGTATAVSNNVSRRQGRRYAEQDQQQAESAQQQAPAPTEDDQMVQLEKLGQLHQDGILTDEEFAAKKKQILGL